MKEYPYLTARQAALTAASAAAVVTATACYLYNRRKHHIQLSSPQSTTPPTGQQPRQSGPSAEESSPPSATTATQPPQSTPSPSASLSASEKADFAWAVFWDIENVPVPRNISAARFVQALRNTLAAHRQQTHPDPIIRLQAIANIHRTPVHLRNQLQANGVNLTHVESKGRKDIADKALITEICLVTREHATPFGICLISGDGDFSYPISKLAALGYATVVIAPTRQSFSTLLASVPGAVIPLEKILQENGHPPVHNRGVRLDGTLLHVPDHRTIPRAVSIPASNLGPLPSPRRLDKRMRRRRRERITPTVPLPERYEGNPRPWSSDDDRSPSHRPEFRDPHASPESNSTLPETEQDAYIYANGFDRPYQRSTPLSRPYYNSPHLGQVHIQEGMRRRNERPSREHLRQDRRQPTTGSTGRPVNGLISRTTPTIGASMEEAHHSPLRSSPEVIDGTPRVRFSGDIIIPSEDQGRRPPLKSILRESGSSGGYPRNAEAPKICDAMEMETYLNSEHTNTSSIAGAPPWLYSRTRAALLAVFVLIFIFVGLFAAFRGPLGPLDRMQKAWRTISN